MECSCCGQDRTTVAMQCHPEIGVCTDCIGWLRGKAGVIDVTPTLPVRDMAEAVAFYESIGFAVRLYNDEAGFGFVTFDEESVFDLGHEVELDPATNRSACYLIVPDVEAWHARVVAAGISASRLADMEWGMREFSVRDPSGNHLRIGCPPITG